MHITLINSSKKRMPRKFIRAWCADMIIVLKRKKLKFVKESELTIVFLDIGEAKKLNLRYRNKDYATDVLSFNGNKEMGQIGELIICPDVIVRQAREHKLLFRQELGYMILHGILHLLGFDHEGSKKEAIEMFKIQDQSFDQLCRKFWA